jgi:hypothetical protein
MLDEDYLPDAARHYGRARLKRDQERVKIELRRRRVSETRQNPSLEFIPSAHTAAENKRPPAGCDDDQTVFIAHLRDALMNVERF